MATITLIISVNMIASTNMRVVILSIISDMDTVIIAAMTITGVMVTLAVMNTLL